MRMAMLVHKVANTRRIGKKNDEEAEEEKGEEVEAEKQKQHEQDNEEDAAW